MHTIKHWDAFSKALMYRSVYFLQKIIGFAALLTASIVQAGVIYQVSDTSVVNCTDAPHGLWTNQKYSVTTNTCANFFSIQPDTFFTIADDGQSATLIGSAKSPDPGGQTAFINLMLSGFAESHNPYKQEGGVAYDPDTDTPDLDFFTLISGTITIGGDIFNINTFVNSYAFQFGLGANAKDPSEFGASAWICADGESCPGGHWDLNLTLTQVPEPGTLGLLGAGLLGLGLFRRYRPGKV